MKILFFPNEKNFFKFRNGGYREISRKYCDMYVFFLNYFKKDLSYLMKKFVHIQKITSRVLNFKRHTLACLIVAHLHINAQG